MSIPVGNYASTDYYNNSAAFAHKGVTFGVDGAVYLYKGLGVGGSISFQDQGKLNISDVTKLAQGYTGDFASDQANVTATNRYDNLNILIGPQYSFEYHRFIVDLRASAGIVKTFANPVLQIKIYDVPEQTGYFYQRGISSVVFGYGANVGIRYKLSDNWTLGVKGIYAGSNGSAVTTEGRTDNVGRTVTRLPISEYQTVIGLTLNLK
jgi:opacity protein-like surface antigen